MTKQEIWEKVEEAYGYDAPSYIVGVGNTFIIVNVEDIISNKSKRLKVTINDVAKYYATQANNIVSGMRSLAGHHGDWRPIDDLAKECLEYFKLINMQGLKKVCKSFGLKPSF